MDCLLGNMSNISNIATPQRPFGNLDEQLQERLREQNQEKYQGLNWLYRNKGGIDLGDYDIEKGENGVLMVSHKGKAVAHFTPEGGYTETPYTTPADRNNITGMSQLGNQASSGSLHQSNGELNLGLGVFLSETIKLILESLKRFLEFAQNQREVERGAEIEYE